MKKVAFVLGGASCVYDDFKNAQALVIPDIIVAVNDIAIRWPYIDYIASYHAELIPRWLAKRRANQLPDPRHIFTFKSSYAKNFDLPYTFMLGTGGSSGLLGTQAALTIANKIILCGIPMDPNISNIARPHKADWPAAKMYQLQWSKVKHKLIGRVKSMSGWTQQLLGAPTVEWLNE